MIKKLLKNFLFPIFRSIGETANKVHKNKMIPEMPENKYKQSEN